MINLIFWTSVVALTPLAARSVVGLARLAQRAAER